MPIPPWPTRHQGARLTHCVCPSARRTRLDYQWGRSPFEGPRGSRLWREIQGQYGITTPQHHPHSCPRGLPSHSGTPNLSPLPHTYDAYSHIAHDGHKEEHAANDVCAAPGEQGTASAEGDLVPCSWTHPALHTYPHPSVIWTHVPERCKRLIKGHIH